MVKVRFWVLLIASSVLILGFHEAFAQTESKQYQTTPPQVQDSPQCDGQRGAGSQFDTPPSIPDSEESYSVFSQEDYPGNPEAADPVFLLVSKTWDSGTSNWIIGLSWSSGTSPYTVSYSTDASFQKNDKTLSAGTSSTSLAIPAVASSNLECYSVTDVDGVSPAVQGMGYDPYPEIPIPSLEINGLWWGDTVTLTGNYLDLIPEANYLGLFARQVKASSVVDGGSGYATSVSFTVPDDGRGAYPFYCTNGKTPPGGVYPFVKLNPRNISAYASIRNVIYAPQTGHIWVAADSTVDEIDIFNHEPSIIRSVTGYTKPYLSQCTTDGRILVVDGVAGVSEIDQIDVSSGSPSLYAYTTNTSHTPNFTRQTLPVGIAVDPDGSAAYIADAISGATHSKAVRFPYDNGSAITDTYGNYSGWSFPDPCGADVGFSHKLYLGVATNYIYYISAPGGNPSGTTTSSWGSTTLTPKNILMDRDLSTSSYDRFWYLDKGWAMAFNQNLIEGNSAIYLGADIFGSADGKLSVEPLREYSVTGNAPKSVILNNSNQSYPYPGTWQTADRVVQFSVIGYNGQPVHLRMIDPADMAAYAPFGGWDAKGGNTAVFPYEAYDNDVWNDASNTDWGLSASPPGTLNRNLEIDVTPPATVYMKLPARYAGDNWQIEVRKKYPGGGVVPNKISSYSTMFTGWKRVFVERDKMFRRGGLLFAYPQPDTDRVIPAGSSTLRIYKLPDGSQWDNLNIGDKIALFDSLTAYESQSHDECYVGEIDRTSCSDYAIVSLTSSDLSTPYTTKCSYTASPWINLTDRYPDFSLGLSAGVGVIYGTTVINGQIVDDIYGNQINGSGSAFYDTDMRAIEKTYNDGFIQFICLRDGTGALPYIANSVGLYVEVPGTGGNPPGKAMRNNFQRLWFKNYDKQNYLHFLGVRGPDEPSGVVGFTFRNSLYTFVHQETIEYYYPADKINLEQTVANHEMGHQCNANKCASHDTRLAWCNTDFPQYCPDEPCLMNADGGTPTNDIRRFCKEDLVLGDPVCGDGRGAIRSETDLVRTE